VDAAEAEAPRFRHLALPEAEYAAWRSGRRIARLDPATTIAFVDVASGRSRTERLVAYRAHALVGGLAVTEFEPAGKAAAELPARVPIGCDPTNRHPDHGQRHDSLS
jgi:hypothetical protein